MPMEPSLDLSHQLSRAERLLARRMSALLERERCTLEEWRVLKVLADGHGHSMSEIADFAMLPAPTLTKLMDRMVGEILVYRRADERDRRRVLAYLAPAGRARHERAAALLSADEADLAASLGDDGALSRWLHRLTDVLTAPLSDEAPASA